MRYVVPIIMVFVVFAAVFNDMPFSLTKFLDDIQYETSLNSEIIMDTMTKFKAFGIEAEKTLDSWKGEHNVDGEWQWYDYIASFFVGVWNGFTDLLNSITQFGTFIIMGMFYLAMILIDILTITVLGFKYLVGIPL